MCNKYQSPTHDTSLLAWQVASYLHPHNGICMAGYTVVLLEW